MATVNGSRKLNLSQPQRVLVAVVYLILLVIIFSVLGGNLRGLVFDSNVDSSILFYAGAFMIILGAYIVEPFFTKPSDSIANSTATLIALFGLSSKNTYFGYGWIFAFSFFVLVASILSILLRESKHSFWSKVSKISYWLAIHFGNYKFIFSVVYLSAAYSYFGKVETIIPFITIVTFWICLTFFDVVGMVIEKLTTLLAIFKGSKASELGQAIGCDNPFLYKVEIDYSKHKRQEVKYGDIVAIETGVNVGSIGMIVSSSFLLNKKWLSIYLLKDDDNQVLKVDLRSNKLITDEKSIFSKDNLVYLLDLDSLPDELSKKVMQNELYQNRENFIGFVTVGSDINKLNFSILGDAQTPEKQISEGKIIKAYIYGQETLYQVINGNTREEHLENYDRHGFIVGIARKLGKYLHDKKELDVSKWMPTVYSPLFFAYNESVTDERTKEIAQQAIGRLPGTNLEIPLKDVDAIVTHNTAILGILGIGKSCLAYELIKKVVAESVKVICIDITNEYKKELPAYLTENDPITSDDENAFNSINSKFEFIHTEGAGQAQKEHPDKSGNLPEYKEVIKKDLCSFLFGQETPPEDKKFEATKKIRIYNLDYHKASKGEKIGYKVITTELTQAEKTRVVAEELFKILMKIPLTDDKKAKVLLVFEEAHSLIPEWNSVASEGDKNATNGTAKIILQGRKYGLGSLVVTQRTANVSKSILNQCNTIFALRVFDDTGKGFLENYIGEDYSSALPSLEERHAIAIGKGLKLKQPVIIQLNDRQHVTTTNQTGN